ncbi:nuclear transport factor 2 family protein [Nocardia sp. NBC_01730]|uniref:YybH family protein n=1 Tax=Nocardia sp. NBC_01730 TaxID=2975998 RepID=UPI002E146683|nr:nuclear transport factor 2 family protein [Nocardia sp. NBC_01730]
MNVSAPTTDAVLATDRRFFDALLAADRANLDVLLAPEFLIVDVAGGDVTARDEFLQFVSDRIVRFTRIDQFPAEAIVRRFGTTAIIVGRTAMEFSLPDGTQITASSRYTHVFVSNDEEWHLVSAQGTAIAGP